MALLLLQATVGNDIARTGTSDPVPVTVSVTRPNGVPVNTLTLANFTVGNTWGQHRIAVTGFGAALSRSALAQQMLAAST